MWMLGLFEGVVIGWWFQIFVFGWCFIWCWWVMGICSLERAFQCFKYLVWGWSGFIVSFFFGFYIQRDFGAFFLVERIVVLFVFFGFENVFEQGKWLWLVGVFFFLRWESSYGVDFGVQFFYVDFFIDIFFCNRCSAVVVLVFRFFWELFFWFFFVEFIARFMCFLGILFS